MQVKANGKVDLWDSEAGTTVELWATDALHALNVHPERYSVEKPEEKPEEKPGPIQIVSRPTLVENNDESDEGDE